MILGVMAASLTLVVMSVSGLNVALPTIQESLEASNSALQWIIDSYALVFAGLLLMAGALGDRFGRRNALLVGLSIFATGAAVGGLAASAVQVIAGRVVMGAGAAFVMPAHAVAGDHGVSTRRTPTGDRRLGRFRGRRCRNRADRVRHPA
jgi:DHA2 family multidrug resistance protein-like MFS transporter